MNEKPLLGMTLFVGAIALSLCTFMQVLDYSIANVSIPYISGGLAVSVTDGIWVITMFAVGNAICLPFDRMAYKAFWIDSSDGVFCFFIYYFFLALRNVFYH